MKKQDKYTIGVVGKELFPQRMHVEKLFGEALYEQIIAMLKLVATEERDYRDIPHLRLGVYLETKNPKSRYFSMPEKTFDIVATHFGHSFYKRIERFSKFHQRRGTDVLYQLNEGNLSMSDFEERIQTKLE